MKIVCIGGGPTAAEFAPLKTARNLAALFHPQLYPGVGSLLRGAGCVVELARRMGMPGAQQLCRNALHALRNVLYIHEL